MNSGSEHLKAKGNGNQTLLGRPASPGSAKGRALVVSDLSFAQHCAATDIVITRAVGPEWLRVILSCAGVATEVGGVTSHAASLCREMKKPAVVGVANITKLLRTGDLVCIDGSLGQITIIGQE